MPYVRKSYRKKPYRKTYRKSYNNNSKLSKQIKSINRRLNVEYKKYDNWNTATIDNAGSVTSLTSIAQGDTDQTRNGNQVKANSLYMRGFIKYDIDLGSTGTTLVRHMIVLDTQQIADTAPAVGDILDATAGLSSGYTLAPLKNETVGRFKVLYDKLHNLSSQQGPQNVFKIYKKLYGTIRYNGTGASDIQKGGIYNILVSDISTVGSYPLVEFHSRLSFIDN